jgi:hypothetical protein
MHHFLKISCAIQIYTGLLVDIFNTVQSELNFSYTFIPTAKYGSLNSKKQWTVLVGMVSRSEVDFGVMDLTILFSRAQVSYRANIFISKNNFF